MTAIRHAAPADIPALARLAASSFASTYEESVDPTTLEAYIRDAFAEEALSRELATAGATFLVAADEGSLLGYAHLLAGQAPDCVHASTPLELVRLYLDPAAVGTGLGSQLMARCLRAAEDGGHDVLWLGVWEHNPTAISFYRRWGFSHVGTIAFKLGAETQTDLVFQRPAAP